MTLTGRWEGPGGVRSCCAQCSPEGGLRRCPPAQPLLLTGLCFFVSRFEKGDRREQEDLRLDCRHERYPARKWPHPGTCADSGPSLEKGPGS